MVGGKKRKSVQDGGRLVALPSLSFAVMANCYDLVEDLLLPLYPYQSCIQAISLSRIISSSQAQQVRYQVHLVLTELSQTGYVGGSVLSRLLNHTLSDTFRITALVRAPEKATQFRKMGIDAVVGSYADHDLLTHLSANADIVIACVSKLHVKAAHPS